MKIRVAPFLLFFLLIALPYLYCQQNEPIEPSEQDTNKTADTDNGNTTEPQNPKFTGNTQLIYQILKAQKEKSNVAGIAEKIARIEARPLNSLVEIYKNDPQFQSLIQKVVTKCYPNIPPDDILRLLKSPETEAWGISLLDPAKNLEENIASWILKTAEKKANILQSAKVQTYLKTASNQYVGLNISARLASLLASHKLNSSIEETVLQIICHNNDTQSTSVLLSLLSDAKALRLKLVIRSLKKPVDNDILAKVEEIFKNETEKLVADSKSDPSLFIICLQKLKEIGNEETCVPILMQALHLEDKNLKKMVSKSLSRLLGYSLGTQFDVWDAWWKDRAKNMEKCKDLTQSTKPDDLIAGLRLVYDFKIVGKEQLLEYLVSQNKLLRIEASNTIVRITQVKQGVSFFQDLEKLLKNQDISEDVRKDIFDTVSKLGKDQGMKILINEWKATENRTLKIYILERMATFKTSLHNQFWMELLDTQDDPRIVSTAISNLQKNRCILAVPGLIKKMESIKDASIQKMIHQALQALTLQKLESDVRLWQEWWQKREF